jgi:hypothetical protein
MKNMMTNDEMTELMALVNRDTGGAVHELNWTFTPHGACMVDVVAARRLTEGEQAGILRVVEARVPRESVVYFRSCEVKAIKTEHAFDYGAPIKGPAKVECTLAGAGGGGGGAVRDGNHELGCRCGTIYGFSARCVSADRLGPGEVQRYEPIPVEERCCAVCNRVSVPKRELRGHDAAVRCFDCHPPTGYERLEQRRGRKYAVGETPDADIIELLAEVDQLKVERMRATSPERLARALFDVRMRAEAAKVADATLAFSCPTKLQYEGRPRSVVTGGVILPRDDSKVRHVLDVMWERTKPKERAECIGRALAIVAEMRRRDG